MKSVTPNAIHTSRVYFTEFDRTTYSQVAWTSSEVDAIRRNLERKLKLLALVKGHVVMASSHLLESELAHEALLEHPRLFSEGVIVPALRSEFPGFEIYLDSKLSEGKEIERYNAPECRDMAQMLDASVALAVRWEVGETSTWFRDRLVKDLDDERGLLRLCLKAEGIIVPSSLSVDLSQIPQPSRKDVYLLAKATGNKQLWDILCNYADFIYYLSGAKAVKSEGVLPQENLMDFTLTDMAHGQTRLSDMEVFYKVFVDIVKTVTHTHFPVDLLDALSIEDVLDLHKVAVQDRFLEKYNIIQEKTKQGLSIHDPEKLVLLMTELEEYECQLHSEFTNALNAELPLKQRQTRWSQRGIILNAIASWVTPWGLVTGAKDVIVSALEYAGKGKIVADTQDRVNRHIKAWIELVQNSSLESKPILLNFVMQINKRYAEKMLNPS